MWTFAAQIPDGLLYGLAPVLFSMVCAWGAWITLTSARTDATSKANAEDIRDLKADVAELQRGRR